MPVLDSPSEYDDGRDQGCGEGEENVKLIMHRTLLRRRGHGRKADAADRSCYAVAALLHGQL
jgi:hypothetical protein